VHDLFRQRHLALEFRVVRGQAIAAIRRLGQLVARFD
jgi:hypothetical protein